MLRKFLSDGHTTGDRPHLAAEKVIEHYNWIWQNMLPTKGSVEVVAFDELKKRLLAEASTCL